MGRKVFSMLWVAALVLCACTGKGVSDIGHPVDGAVLLEEVSGSQVGDRLSVTGLDGKLGEIDVPAPALGMATNLPGLAVYTTGSGAVFLVDTAHKAARRLDIPAHVGVIFNPILFGESDRFLVLGSPRGDAGYLVDLHTGAATNLIGLAGAKQMFSAEFAPDGKHLAFFGDELVLVPTADPKGATELGAGKATGFAGFTEDGKRVGFIDVSNPTHPILSLQDVEGVGRRVVNLPAGTVRAHLMGNGDRAVLQESNRLSLLDTRTGGLTELTRFRGSPRLSWFGPEGTAMLFASQQGSHATWDWIDLQKVASHELPDLRDYQPLLSSPSDSFVFFADGRVPGKVRSLRVLDMSDGRTKQAFGLGKGQPVPGYQIASGGRFALIPVERGRGGDLWVVPAQGSEARMVASSSRGLPLGTFSPSGDWVAVSNPPRPGQTPSVSAVATTGHRTSQLGKGVRPVWVRGA